MICSYLLHNDHFSKSQDALKYYGDARTRNAKGVTIPSQRRYVLYYSHKLTHHLEYTRTMVLLKGFEMTPVPSFQNSTCSKCFNCCFSIVLELSNCPDTILNPSYSVSQSCTISK